MVHYSWTCSHKRQKGPLQFQLDLGSVGKSLVCTRTISKQGGDEARAALLPTCTGFVDAAVA
jgi:hypothetical protein